LTIKAVLFDLEGTLLDFDFEHPAEIFQIILASLGISKSLDEIKTVWLKAEKDTNLSSLFGKLPPEEWGEKWKPYAKCIIFHELREIYYRAKGFERDYAHEKAIEDQRTLWKHEALFLKMIRDMEEMDRKTAEKKRRLKPLK
jgi:beta-phosphoglucomutase-like phosphatase (HAD superfamily)